MRWRRWLAVPAVSLVAWAVSQAAPGAPRAPQAGAGEAAIATVGPLKVTRGEFEQRVQQGLAEYRQRSGQELPATFVPTVRRQLLESLIRRDLLVLETRRRGALASEQEAIDELKKDPFFQPGGRFDDARFNVIRTQQPDKFAFAVQQMRENLGARRLAEEQQRLHAPAEASVKTDVAKKLKSATVEALVLRRGDFTGLYPEPREADVLAWYHAHVADYARPERATISVVTLATASHAARAEQRADSALAAIHKGATLEQVAERLGLGVQGNVTVMRDNAPGLWKGSAADMQALFQAKPGAVLPHAVAGREGLLLVRLDRHEPAAPAPLREVARTIRQQLRASARLHADDDAATALYGTLRDSLRTTGVRVRWAVVDTTSVNPGEPAAADIDRWYHSHLADYSTFDAKAGGVVARPLAEVQDDVRARWRHDARVARVRELTDGLRQAWAAGRRDPALERGVAVHEAGPVVPGVAVDSSAAGRALGEQLGARGAAVGADVVDVPGGALVFAVTQRVAGFVPPLEQVRPQLARRLADRRHAEEEAGAHALYDADPVSFATGRTLHASRLIVPPADLFSVDMTHAEVERWHREHMDQYAAPEQVAASHILITPKDASPEADRAARARADSLAKRAKAGEDFATLARTYTDDDATRDAGGDLGAFGRGTMLEAFEKAAFSMHAGDISDPVKSEVGYHVIKVTDHLPAMAQPLAQVYANVSADLARVKADTVSARRADSLARLIHTPAQARTAARKLGFKVSDIAFPLGQPMRVAGLENYFATLESLKPGQFVPGTVYLKGQGWAITWVDSVTAPIRPAWDQARNTAIDRWRRQSGQRAFDGKLAELDSLMRAGWSLDSVAAMYGGLARLPLTPGMGIPGVEATETVDSLVFGVPRGHALATGASSGWLSLQAGALRLRVAERGEPSASQLAAEVERQRRIATDTALEKWFDELKHRYPVRILDSKLRATALPPLPSGPGNPSAAR